MNPIIEPVVFESISLYIIPFVLATVGIAKKTKYIPGEWLPVVALISGVVGGLLMSVDPIMSAIMGLSASGLYDVAKVKKDE